MSINVKDITIGEGLPKVCVPIVEDNDEAILDKLKEFDQLDVDIIELRIDFYKNILQFDALKNLFLNIAALQIKKPIILTIRTAAEGGEIEIDPKDYFHVYELGIESKAFDIYDVELALGTNMAIELRTLIHDANKYMLMSAHHFNRTPEVDSLMQKFKSMDSLEADIMKIAMIGVNRRLKEQNLKSRLVLQVHDELLIEAYRPELPEVEKILREEMEQAASLDVPLEIDMHTGENWYEAK